MTKQISLSPIHGPINDCQNEHDHDCKVPPPSEVPPPSKILPPIVPDNVFQSVEEREAWTKFAAAALGGLWSDPNVTDISQKYAVDISLTADDMLNEWRKRVNNKW